MATSANAGISEFFRGETMLAFVNQYQAGRAPWGSTLMADGNLVLSEADRSRFYVLHDDGRGNYGVSYVDDAIALMDADFSPLDDGMVDGRVVTGEATPEAAFMAMCEKLELDLDLDAPGP